MERNEERVHNRNGPANSAEVLRQFDTHTERFRQHWHATNEKRGYPFQRYLPAYKYGWEAGSRRDDRAWEEVEPQLRDRWEQLYPSDVWNDVRECVKLGWETYHQS